MPLPTSAEGNHYSNFCQLRFACVWTSYKGNHVGLPLLCLGYPVQHHVYESVSVICWILLLNMDKPQFILCGPVGGHLGWSQSGALLNSTAHMFLSILLLDIHAPFSCMYLGVGLMDYRVGMCLILVDTATQCNPHLYKEFLMQLVLDHTEKHYFIESPILWANIFPLSHLSLGYKCGQTCLHWDTS